jgi:nucleoside-diphosphate-sugar epimerase
LISVDFSVSDEKARRELGWKPPVSHEEGTRREGEWYKNKYNVKT